MHSVLNTLSECTYFYMSKNITSYTFLVVFEIVESIQCIPKSNPKFSIKFAKYEKVAGTRWNFCAHCFKDLM